VNNSVTVIYRARTSYSLVSIAFMFFVRSFCCPQ